jgi:Acetyl xylan esterase (AXE1)
MAEQRPQVQDHGEEWAGELRTFSQAMMSPRTHGSGTVLCVALMDEICPPSTVYAAYKRLCGDEGRFASTPTTITVTMHVPRHGRTGVGSGTYP